MKNMLHYYKPAKCFEEAMPIGNGNFGGMVYSDTDIERISLNNDTLWSGSGKDKPMPPDPVTALRKAQEAILREDDPKKAEEIIAEGFNSILSHTYLPMGDLLLKFGHVDVTDYRRSLDMRNGLCATEYLCGGVRYKREVFSSYPGDLMAVSLWADKGKALRFRFGLQTELKMLSYTFADGVLILNGIAPAPEDPYVTKQPELFQYEAGLGMNFCVQIKVATDGEISFCDGEVCVENADRAVLYLSTKTNFKQLDLGQEKTEDYLKDANAIIKNLELADFELVKQAHVEDFSRLYDRVRFSICDDDSAEDTGEMLKNFDGTQLSLYERFFEFGRYLTISASREGTIPTNLQGIWNEKLLAPWNSNYTININTEMNYWPVFITNLSECFEPLITFMEKLRIKGQRTAKGFYNARGFVAHHNSDIWGMTNPVGYNRGPSTTMFSFWNMASGWFAMQLYDLYEYTLDVKKLERIYPIMHDAALFYCDIMYRDEDGYYMVCPSTSPENNFVRDGDYHNISKTTAMTTSILRELFTRLLKASEILGVHDEVTEKVGEMLPHIYPLQIGKDGRILEWAKEEEEYEVTHRHVSHLISLYPGNLITPDGTPELAEAVKQSLIGRGDDGTGWSLAWKINLWAFLRDGNHALKLMDMQLRMVDPFKSLKYVKGGTYPNLFDAHPPFQIDGNYGVCAAVCNMLMQSEIGSIRLLPALPDRWKRGSISGIVAKGNVTVDMRWDNGKVVALELVSPVAQKITVNATGTVLEVKLEKNQKTKVL